MSEGPVPLYSYIYSVYILIVTFPLYNAPTAVDSRDGGSDSGSGGRERFLLFKTARHRSLVSGKRGQPPSGSYTGRHVCHTGECFRVVNLPFGQTQCFPQRGEGGAAPPFYCVHAAQDSSIS